MLAPIGLCARKKAFKREPSRGHTRYCKRCYKRAGAGNGFYRNIVFIAKRGKVLARVRNNRHTRVRNKSAVFAVQKAFKYFFAALRSVVLIIAHHRLFNAEMI